MTSLLVPDAVSEPPPPEEQARPDEEGLTMSRSVSSVRRRPGPILLVDDYDDARSSVREALEDAGHTVLEAADGQQALNLLVSRSTEQVALIILDLQMPVMDGWRFIELLRCYVALSHIPIIVVTGHDPHLERVSHRGVIGCLQAPYELKTLIGMVDSCFQAETHDPSVAQR
jgi:type IV pili sensor histidine kinase/response regulator